MRGSDRRQNKTTYLTVLGEAPARQAAAQYHQQAREALAGLPIDVTALMALADFVTARAVAPLSELLGHCLRWLKPGGVALLHRGVSIERELTQAAKDWTMQLLRHQSQTDPRGVVLEIRELARIDGQ